MSSCLVIIILIHICLHRSEASPCSELDLSTSNKNTDENYSIQTEKLPSTNILKVSLIKKSIISDTSWFLMGASDSLKLVGSWQPFTPMDGQVIDCSSSSSQIVTNENSLVRNSDQLQYAFYWIPPISLNEPIVFVATIFYRNEKTTMTHIQSLPIEINQNRYQDVSPTFCDSSPCLNGGTCIRDTQYSFCRCVAPWNGVFCALQYFHMMLASTQPFTTEFYFNTLNSPSYTNLTTSLTAYLNSAFSTLPANRIYSINSVSPSPIGTYLSISVALTPTSGLYTPVILSALATALARNSTTPFGHQLSISPTYISNAVTQDGTPYTSCVFPYTFNLLDYNFCIPYQSNFVCSSTRVIDRNATLSSLDCSRNIFNYITRDVCFPSICLNGGTCVNVNGIATCNCPAYFTGSRCDQLYGCNPVTNSQAVTCANGATCVGNICACTSNNTVGTLCEIVAGNTGCNFPFTYMGVSYSTCAVINNQPLCVARTYASNGQFPISLVGCGAPQCQNNPCGNRGTCQDTVSGSFRCINCVTGYNGYFCELQYRTVQLTFNVTYTPDLQNASSNASKQLQGLINQTLSTAFVNITNGGVRPDIIQYIQNPDGTTSVVINVNTNYLNFLNNSTQNALDKIGAITTVLVNTTRDCAPWYIYQGRNVTGCVTNPQNVPICSLTNNFDRDGQFTSCPETINLNLCNGIYCNGGRCIATSRNLTYCVCPSGVTGTNCDQLLQCSDLNCLNNGTCVALSTSYFRCNCAPGYGGTYCQYSITGCVFPFVDNQNRTQNTCITTNDYMNGTVPWCRNIQGLPQSCQIDYCAQKPCKYGVCVPSIRWAFGNSYPAFICNCTAGYTGQLCTHAYFRIKSFFSAPNMSTTLLNALESPTTQAYQNLMNMFRDLIRNRTNSSFDFLPLMFTTFRGDDGNYIQVTADASYAGNISQTQINNILRPILANLPPQFNLVFDNTSLTDIDDVQPLSAASNCTLPYGYNSQSLAVCHVDSNGLAYCSYGQNYTLADRKLCDASGLPTAMYTACEGLSNPCNSTLNFPIRCVASDTNWTCFCEVTQTLGRDCGNLDFCRNGSLLCRNNASCINRPDLQDFACNCTDPYYGRLCENFGRAYKIFLTNYSNETSPGIPTLISQINQTIINMTNGGVIATSITISPSGEVTIVVTGRNYSIPDFELPLTDKVRTNWTVGPYVVSFNQTSLVTIQTNATCVFPFAYNGVNYTTCITTGYDFPWCSTTPTYTGRIVDCRNVDWCASGPCLNNGTCSINQQLGTFQCKCVDGWVGVRCAYPSTTITIVIPLGNNTLNNVTLLNITNSLPNGTNIDIIKPGPNNTVIIIITVNGTNTPNITWPVLNITKEPTKNVDGCVFPFIYNNESYSSCIPVFQNRTAYCCRTANCDVNPQWQFCNNSNICSVCAPNANCILSAPGIITCICPVGFTGSLCDTTIDLCVQRNQSCLNNGVCVINPITLLPYCNCSSSLFTGIRCETFIPCLQGPCLNNGTCSAYTNATVRCNCSNCYSGAFCPICATYITVGCGNVTCLNGGTCLINNDRTICQCPSIFTGTRCESLINSCDSNPCVNGGTCYTTGMGRKKRLNGGVCRSTETGGVVCACPVGFTGVRCETSILPCDSNPCLNKGVCIYDPVTMQMKCQCCGLATGTFCEILLNPCNNSIPYCFNNGTCVLDSNSKPMCMCPSTFTGLYCETYTNPCTCTTINNGLSYACICPSQLTGPNCLTANPCGLQPCLNGGTFSSPCASNPCINGGTCQIVGTSYTCLCPTVFTGPTCSQSLSLCSTIQCINGGTCSDYGSFAICNCLINFTGERCQYVNQCYPTSPCLNGGTCISVLNSFSCQCPVGRTGTTCQLFSDNPCAGGQRCLNGGTCTILSGTNDATCLCPTNFAGQSCEQITTTTTSVSSSIVTILPEKSSTVIETTSMINFNTTNAPYSCDDTSLACLAYRSYCSPEYEFSGIPCRVLCPRTCDTCCDDFYKDGTCSLENCRRNSELEPYCRKSCICKI
ncbi:hypothetical protein I4U23_017673 [Adineta vaga]|nr:hypothetical protein I4U23_017673 [Adineta vaga]